MQASAKLCAGHIWEVNVTPGYDFCAIQIDWGSLQLAPNEPITRQVLFYAKNKYVMHAPEDKTTWSVTIVEPTRCALICS